MEKTGHFGNDLKMPQYNTAQNWFHGREGVNNCLVLYISAFFPKHRLLSDHSFGAREGRFRVVSHINVLRTPHCIITSHFRM